jgi:hypothetical protein
MKRKRFTHVLAYCELELRRTATAALGGGRHLKTSAATTDMKWGFTMTTKQWIMIGTIVIMITLNGGPGKDGLRTAEAATLTFLGTTSQAESEEAISVELEDSSNPLALAIGEEADSVIYDALLEGKTLADVAYDHGADVDSLISHQVAQLTTQLDQRLAGGSISEEVYAAQREELYDIVAKSVHGL